MSGMLCYRGGGGGGDRNTSFYPATTFMNVLQ